MQENTKSYSPTRNNMMDRNDNNPRVYASNFDDIGSGPTVQVNVRNPKLTRLEKRAIIKHQLQNNFPVGNVLIFGFIFILIGFAGIGLQIAIIVNQGPGYYIGNGIWGGFFAILNGLIKLNICKK